MKSDMRASVILGKMGSRIRSVRHEPATLCALASARVVEIAKAVNARYLQLMAMREDLASVRVGLSIVRNAW